MKYSYLLLTCFCVVTLVQGEGFLSKNDRMLASYDLEDGTYIITVIGTGQVFDIPGASTAAGTELIQYPYTGNPNQRFKVEKISTGIYKITNVNSGLVLDVAVASTVSGTSIIQYPSLGQPNQQFRISSVVTCFSDGAGHSSCTLQGYQMTSVNSGLIISVAGGSTSPGAKIIQASNPPQGSYLLRFTKV